MRSILHRWPAVLVTIACLLTLGGCAGGRSAGWASSAQDPCAAEPGGYGCQVERYTNAP